MLKNQIAKSNNGIERSKYITFGLPAEGIAEARPRLERVEADVTGNLKRLGRSLCSDGWAGTAGAASQSDAPRQPGAVPLLLAGHSPDGHGDKGLYCPGQLRLPAIPDVPGGPVFGALRPTCRFWRPSSLTSSWRKFWSWMRK